MKWTREAVISLRTALANKYPTIDESLLVVQDAGLDRTRIAFNAMAIINWDKILDHADKTLKIDAVLDRALKDYSEDDVLLSLKQGRLPPEADAPAIEDVQWKGKSGKSELEKIIGAQSTLVPITYLELGLMRSKSVARIRRSNGALGSGFLTTDNILITNHHVLPDVAAARDGVAQFNYQQVVDGGYAPSEDFRLSPDEFFKTSEDDDWTAVKVADNPASKYGALALKPAPKLAVGDNVNIIQHPGGGLKQISLNANVIVFADANRVQYLTDTLPGSSGSPVFNTEWAVIAVHHSGGWLAEPNAKSKTTYYRNEGIRIDKIVEGLKV